MPGPLHQPDMNPPTADFARLAPAPAPAPPAPEPAVRPDTAEVLGAPLALTDNERTMAWMDCVGHNREASYLSAAGVHLVMLAHEDDPTRAAVDKATLVVPDGQPLVWALRSLGHEASRVYGPDLMAKYCERSAQTGTRMYLYGGRHQGALVELALRARRRSPRRQNGGGYPPPLSPPPPHVV